MLDDWKESLYFKGLSLLFYYPMPPITFWRSCYLFREVPFVSIYCIEILCKMLFAKKKKKKNPSCTMLNLKEII